METEKEKHKEGVTMQSAEEKTGCTFPLIPSSQPNKVDTFRPQLPAADPEDLQFSFGNSLLQIPPLQWRRIKDGTIDSETYAYVSDFVMDLLQALSQSILTAVLPQLFKYMSTNRGLLNVLLTEDAVATYLGDSVQKALAMSFNKQTVKYSINFSQLLTTTITRKVNKVLTLCSLTPVCNDVLPVFFVTGADCPLLDLWEFTTEAVAILKSAVTVTQNEGPVEPQSDVFEMEDYCVLYPLSKNYTIDFLVASLTRLVNTLRISSHTPHRKLDSSPCCQRDMCLLVGSSAEILTADWESNPEHGPVHNDKSQPEEIWPFSKGNVPKQNNCKVINPAEMEAIEQTAEALVTFIWPVTEEQFGEVFEVELDKEIVQNGTNLLTHNIFNIVMGIYCDQVPLIPPGLSLGELVTFRSPHPNDPGLIAHCVYLKTEEMINRAFMQVLQWAGWIGQFENVVHTMESSDPVTHSPELVIMPRGGDHPDLFSEEDSDSYGESEDEEEEEVLLLFLRQQQQQQPCGQSLRSVLQTNLIRSSFMVLIVGEILTLAGMTDISRIQLLLRKMITQLDLNTLVREPYDALVMGRSYRDICDKALHDLLDLYGSAPALHQAVTEPDSSFDEVLKEVIQDQLRMPASSSDASSDLTPLTKNSEEEAVPSYWDRLMLFLRRLCCSCGLHIHDPSMTPP